MSPKLFIFLSLPDQEAKVCRIYLYVFLLILTLKLFFFCFQLPCLFDKSHSVILECFVV